MGKRIISQRRGKGSPTYKSPSHKFRAAVRHIGIKHNNLKGKITDIVTCPGHSSPLAVVKYENGEQNHIIAPEGVHVEQEIEIGSENSVIGNQ